MRGSFRRPRTTVRSGYFLRDRTSQTTAFSSAGALPGAFKNLLEWTVGDGGTYDKPIAWINASGPAAPTGASDAHDSLRKVLGYVHADIVEEACTRIPVTRDAVGPDGTVSDSGLRQQIAETISTLANRLRSG